MGKYGLIQKWLENDPDNAEMLGMLSIDQRNTKGQPLKWFEIEVDRSCFAFLTLH